MKQKTKITLQVNSEMRTSEAEPRMLLSDFLRDVLDYTGTHVGCEHGICGACTVLVNGEAVRSCLMFAVQAEGQKIETVESLSKGNSLHPLQELFSKHRALQCGFCTPGMLLTAIDLVQNNPAITKEEIQNGMSAVLCRCTGYEGIITAVTEYANGLKSKNMKKSPQNG